MESSRDLVLRSRAGVLRRGRERLWVNVKPNFSRRPQWDDHQEPQ